MLSSVFKLAVHMSLIRVHVVGIASSFCLVVHRLGINMDPPQRFSSNRPYRPLAEAVCQRRLIAAQGWDMITLPQHEWRRNVTQKERAAYLEKLLDCTLDDRRDSLSKISSDSDASAACRKAAVAAAAAAARAAQYKEHYEITA